MIFSHALPIGMRWKPWSHIQELGTNFRFYFGLLQTWELKRKACEETQIKETNHTSRVIVRATIAD